MSRRRVQLDALLCNAELFREFLCQRLLVAVDLLDHDDDVGATRLPVAVDGQLSKCRASDGVGSRREVLWCDCRRRYWVAGERSC